MFTYGGKALFWALLFWGIIVIIVLSVVWSVVAWFFGLFAAIFTMAV